MKRGYARVSTLDQDLGRQVDALQKYGCEKVYTDKISGRKARRPALDQLLTDLVPGDIVVIQKLDRLGRSLIHLLELVKMFETKQVDLISLTDNFDTTTSQGKFLFNILGSVAEFERDLIRERTINGLAFAKQNGAKLGKPGKYNNQELIDAISLQWRETRNISLIARTHNITPKTARKLLKHVGLKKNILPDNQRVS